MPRSAKISSIIFAQFRPYVTQILFKRRELFCTGRVFLWTRLRSMLSGNTYFDLNSKNITLHHIVPGIHSIFNSSACKFADRLFFSISTSLVVQSATQSVCWRIYRDSRGENPEQSHAPVTFSLSACIFCFYPLHFLSRHPPLTPFAFSGPLSLLCISDLTSS